MKAQSRSVVAIASLIGMVGYASPLSAQLSARSTYVDDGSFQLPPAGTTSPREPVALGVGSDGSVHIVDRDGVVFVFTSSGAAEGSYGSGHLGRPTAIAFDDRDAAYVLDRDPKRIQVFKPDREWWYTIGAARRGPARLQSPIAVAVGPNGFVHVLDESGPAIRIFGRDGVFVRIIDLQQQVQEPIGLAVDGDGTILVTAKKLPGTVFQLPPFSDVPWNGSATPQAILIGASGEIVSAATDGHGTVVVLDSKDRRLWGGQRVEPNAATLARSIYGGTGTGRGSFREPVDLAFTRGRDLLILDRELRKIERIGLSDEEPTVQLASGFPIHVSQLPPDLRGALMDVRGPAGGPTRFAVASAEGRNVELTEGIARAYTDFFGTGFRSYSLPTDTESGGFRPTLRNPIDDLAFNDTLMVIAEPREDGFSVYDLRDGRSLGTYGRDYEDDRRLKDPSGIDLFPDGSIAVADKGNNRVAIFSADLASLLGSFPFLKVQGVAVSPTGDLFAWDEDGLSVAQVPFDGSPVQQLSRLLLPGQVRDMAFDGAGNLFILEEETSRVTVIDSSRENVFVRFGGSDPEFKASHVSVDGAGNVYIGSLERDSTHVFRWDLSLPDLADFQVTLTPNGATVSWSPIESPFLQGYRVLGSDSGSEPFEVVVSTGEQTANVSLRSTDSMRWLRVAPMTITGSLASGSDAIPLLHLDIIAASNAGQPGSVVGSMGLLDELVSEGTLRIADDLSQQLQWHALDAEAELGLFSEAAARAPALEGWTGNDRGFSLHRRLAEVHNGLGNGQAVLEHATQALAVLPEADRDGEPAIDLLRMGVDAAFASGAFASVVGLGGQFRADVDDDEEYELLMRMATARLELGQPAQALRMAEEVLERDLVGDIAAYGNDRSDLGWVAFRSSILLGDEEVVERWRAPVEPTLEGARLQQFLVLMGGFRLSQGNTSAALASLTALTSAADAGVFQDPAAVDLSLGVYRALQEADSVDHTAGLVFLQQYTDGIPASLGDLRDQYADSLAEFSLREDTKAKLGQGFQAWRDANFVDLIQFLEDLVEHGDLTREQETLARALLAGAYADIGRSDAAAEALRMILVFDPEYDAQSATNEAEELYGVTLFSASLMELLQEIRDAGPGAA